MNLDKLIEANKEIAQLKALLDLSEKKRDLLLDANYELRAIVDRLRNTPHVCGGHGCRHCETLNKTPRQCLASVKADAIDDLAEVFQDEWPEHRGKYYWMIGTAVRIREAANET